MAEVKLKHRQRNCIDIKSKNVKLLKTLHPRTQNTNIRLKKEFYLGKCLSVNTCSDLFQISHKHLGIQKVPPLSEEPEIHNCDHLIDFYNENIRRIFLVFNPATQYNLFAFDGVKFILFQRMMLKMHYFT